MNRSQAFPLLAELHSHTRWSDGELTVAELVHLYGRHGFDVLCISDHVVRRDDPCLLEGWGPGVTAANHAEYLEEIEREAASALKRYGMLVLPGLELSYNDLDPLRAAHVVAVGLREFVPVDDGPEQALRSAATTGAAVIAAHPSSSDEPVGTRRHSTRAFAADPGLRALAHRFELFNRSNVFAWVADEGLPVAASGDFHRLEHLPGWKTVIPCAQSEAAVVEYLRSPRPVFLSRFDPPPLRVAA